MVSGTVVGTYLHGSLLPKNPALVDWLLRAALRHQAEVERMRRCNPSTTRRSFGPTGRRSAWPAPSAAGQR